jgi:hypothetical protein
VKIATTSDTIGTTDALNAVDRSAQAEAERASEATTDTLRSGRTYALVLMLATLVLALAAATMCAWGINQRRKEYA